MSSNLPKITVHKEGPLLFFYKEGSNTVISYDLVKKDMKRKRGNENCFYHVEHQYHFFSGYELKDLEFKTEKFQKLIEFTKELYTRCKSISSFITYLSETLIYEHYLERDLKFDAYVDYDSYYGGYSRRGIQLPLTEYNKNVIKIFKKNGWTFTRNVESLWHRGQTKFERLIFAIDLADITPEQKNEILRGYLGDNHFSDLIHDYNYEPKALIEFVYNYLIPFEGLESYDSFRTLRDYYRMASAIGRKVKRYPKYLKSMHDIIQANYMAFRKSYDEQLFKNLMKQELIYENKTDKFCICIPENSKDIINEGSCLNHCVSSYVDKILEGKTYIFFLRYKKEKETPLVTLELKSGKIVQAKGSYNRKLEKEELDFLNKYARVKKLAVGDRL